MIRMRTNRLEVLVLSLLVEPIDLEALYARLKPLCPTLRRERLFGLLVRLKREGRVGFSEGRFFRVGSGKPPG